MRRRSRRTARRTPARNAAQTGRAQRRSAGAPARCSARWSIGASRSALWGVIARRRPRRLLRLAVCRRSTSSPCPSARPTSPFSAPTASLLANRGDTGGAAVRLADLPPYLPKAFVAIEDRRFYSHWGIDPIGIARAHRAQRHRPRRHAGRLDADPAARQESVPDAGAHDLAQDPGGDPRALAGAQIFEGPDPRTLSQPRLFRLRRLWRRGGGAEIFRP